MLRDPSFRYQLPRRLWRKILQAHDNDEQLAHTVLATAFLVAAENVSVPHCPRPAPTPPPPPVCPHCGGQHCQATFPPGATTSPQDDWDRAVADADGYLVNEQPPHEMPVQDPWARSWD